MKVMLAGGGTVGSVTPLIALVQELRKRDSATEFFWLGTKKGPEKELIEKYNIQFKAIPAGKLRRYWSFRNLIDPFLIECGIWKSMFQIIKFKPDIIVSAGGFVAVPVIWAGWILRKKTLIHQLDVRPGLANKLCAPFAKKITVSFEKSIQDYGKFKEKVIWTGVPVREDIFQGSKELAVEKFKMQTGRKVLLVLGGGTGAQALNQLIVQAVPELTRYYEIIHITGKGKQKESDNLSYDKRYHYYEFLTTDLIHALASADLVITRCGIGFLSELAALGKASILIPIPDSHQEDNAKVFADADAAVVWNQKELKPEQIISGVRTWMSDDQGRKNLGERMKKVLPIEGVGKIVDEIIKLVETR